MPLGTKIMQGYYHHNCFIIVTVYAILDVTKMRNGMISRMMHRMGRLHRKASFYQCSLVYQYVLTYDLTLRMALLFA